MHEHLEFVHVRYTVLPKAIVAVSHPAALPRVNATRDRLLPPLLSVWDAGIEMTAIAVSRLNGG